MKLLNFDNFKKLQAIRESDENLELALEESIKQWEGEQILNEGFASGIMQMLSDSDTDNNRWRKGFASDLYKKFGVAVSEIQDTDFELLTDPSMAFQRPYKDDDNKLIFLINDDTELRDKWTTWQKGRAPFPFLVGIVQGGVNLWYGFRKTPSTGYRNGQSKEDRYGVLAKSIYTSQDYFGRETKIGTTQKAYVEFSTKAYVLDLASLREKYSTSEKQIERAAARKGATALISAKDVKAANINRYKKILSEKLGPADILAQFQAVFNDAVTGISSWVSSTKLDNLDVVQQYGTFDFGSWQRQDIGQTLQQLYRTYGEYIRDYVDYARYQSRIEKLAMAIETGKGENGEELDDATKMKYAANMEYYQQDLQQRAVKFVEYKQHFDKCDKQIKAGVATLNNLLNVDKSTLNLRDY